VDADLTAAMSLGVDTPSDMQLWIDAGTKRSYQATADRIVSIERPTDGAIEATFRASRWGHPGAPGLAGTIAVRCGEPPPLGADRTVGRLTFQVGHDGPVYQTGAVCEWVLMDLQATVSRVDALRNRVRMGADQFGATDIEMTSGQGRSLTASLYVGSRFDFNGTEYHDNRTAFPLWAAEDGHAGLLRVLRMLPGEWDSDASLLSDTPGLNMLMSWDCGSPPDPIGTQLTYTEIHGRPGLVTVHLPGMPLAGQVVAASCTAREDEHGWTHPGGVAASFRWGGRDALLVTGSDGFVGLFLREADGSYSGEYSSANPGPGQTWGDGDDGHIDFPATTLTRTWPASDTATAGPPLPATLTISMEWDCQPGLGPLK